MRKSNTGSSISTLSPFLLKKVPRSGVKSGLNFGHSAFAADVTVTIVETSNVGVKVGMVGR